MAFRAGVITVSDRGFQGERTDLSGPLIEGVLQGIGIESAFRALVPDERPRIREILRRCVDEEGLDLVVTTGGTGVSPRDVTPEATRDVIEREIPGIGEAMRRNSMARTPHAMLSRAIAGIRGRSLILNLPGSPRGAEENLAAVLPALRHALDKIQGDTSECAAP